MTLSKLLSFCLVMTWSMYGRDYCSLVVKIIDPQGRRRDARITVEEKDGRNVIKEAETGEAKYCDLGIFPVTVTIGHPECNQVVIRNVPLTWDMTTNTTAIYDVKPCQVDSPV